MACDWERADGAGRWYAHSVAGRPSAQWQPLEAHLRAVSGLAERFASAFGSGAWGRLAGLWHDLGKYQADFQRHLAGDSRKVDHAVVGALVAAAKDRQGGLPLAFVIAGHHGGLANLRSVEATPPTPLQERLESGSAALSGVLPQVPDWVKGQGIPPLPEHLAAKGRPPADDKGLRRSAEFWIRFLFSALVDADFLDTEEFFRPGLRKQALAGYEPVSVLRRRLDAYLDARFGQAEATPVNRVRAEVLRWCRAAAEQPPGLFSLTVPTGGGKTLSAMAFALRHAERHGLRRVIAVIPYTSIIEQNAAVYREALGAANVLEHHSNLDPEKETDTNRLASENWDAPVIVTTAVQFFESLFSNRPSACRRLHNIARSVVLLDEAQTLPSGFLLAVLEALRELVEHYGSTVALSTATQPALVRRESMSQGLDGVREIAADPAALARALRRVVIEWIGPDSPPVAWPDLAAQLAEQRQVLAVVHRREDARELARLLPDEGRFHLSALMCPKHRSDVLARVKAALKSGAVCRLVSTQLIEAGVDIDFPVVYRALGGLDAVVQAAGRCNREGKRDTGRVIVFRAPTAPPGDTFKGLQTMEALLRQYGVALDATDPGLVEAYFRNLYFKQDLDAARVQPEREELNFANVAQRFRLIDDAFTYPVVVPYGDSSQRLDVVRRQGPTRENLRALQPFLVNVYERDFRRLQDVGAVELLGETVHALVPAFRHQYSGAYGLVLEGPLNPDPACLVE